MLSSMLNMFRVADLRKRIVFTLLMILLYRIGAFMPAPGIDVEQVQLLRDRADQGGVLAFMQLFSGGSLTSFAVFALGVMPYITASIIMQVLGVVVPRIEQWQQQGAVGQRKITQWTRYLTVVIAVIQSTSFAFLFNDRGNSISGQSGANLLPDFHIGTVSVVVLTLTAGTALLMWIGELITQKGIGNGMSLLIMISIVSGFPAQGSLIQAENGSVALAIVLAVLVSLVAAIVFIEQGQRRIPVQFAKRVVGRRMYGGQNTYIPLKVNQSGVIPIIFASSVLYLPVLIAAALPWEGFRGWIDDNLAQPDNVLLHDHRPPDRRLRVLLHGDHVRSREAGRHHPQAGRLRTRYPPRLPDRAVPGQDPVPDHPARCLVHRQRGADPIHPHQRLPGYQCRRGLDRCGRVRLHRHLDPDRGRRVAGDDEAGRFPADDAQLRGLP